VKKILHELLAHPVVRKQEALNTKPEEAGHGTILIMDDDDSMRMAPRVTLSGMGFTVMDASRGEEALTLVQLTRFDAVLPHVDISATAILSWIR
jgi:DNA-binding NtrC family response regulator